MIFLLLTPMASKEILYLMLLFVGTAVGAYRYRRLSDSVNWLFWLLAVTLLSEVTAELLVFFRHNNLFVFHIYNPVQYLFFALAYTTELKIDRYAYGSVIFYWVFALINALFFQPFFEEFCSYSFSLNTLLVSGLSLFYLYRLLQEETENSVFDYPLFWVSVGYLLYCVVNFFGLGAFNSLEPQETLALALATARTLTNYILYSLFIVAFLRPQKQLTR